MTGQLGMVGKLLEENLRLGSVVRQLQVRVQIWGIHARDNKCSCAYVYRRETKQAPFVTPRLFTCFLPLAVFWRPLPENVAFANLYQHMYQHINSHAFFPSYRLPQSEVRRRQEQAQPTKVMNADATSTPRRKGVGDRGIGPKYVEAGAKDDENLDLDMALSEIKALTGMVRAQEEIETLLGRELDDLKSKHAGNRESVWRLLTRYSESR